MGRKLKLNADIIDKLEQQLSTGVTYEAAASLAGISKQTFWTWMKTADEIADRIYNMGDLAKQYEPSVTESLYLDFIDSVTRARATIEQYAVTNIIAAGTTGITYTVKIPVEQIDEDGKKSVVIVEREMSVPPDAKHLEWWLERGMPKQYARRNAVELSGKDGGPIPIAAAVQIPVDDESLRRLAQVMHEAQVPLPPVIEDAEIIDVQEA